MPDGIRYFSVNGTVGAIPAKNVDVFLKENPQAKEQGKFILEDKTEGYIPFENVNGFLTDNPKAKADQHTYNNYNGWAQGKQTEQTIYSGVKPAGVPYAAGTVLMPGKAWESTKEQPFYIPTAEESKELAQNRIQETPSNTKGNFLSNQFEKSKNDTYDIRTGLKVAGQNAWGAVKELPDLVTKELADRFSGPKPGDFSYGLGYNPKTIENEPIQNTAQKIAADADIRIEQHARSLQEASVGNEGWAYVGAALPTLFELGAATFSRSPELTKLVIDKMAATAYLKAGVAYDNHIKETGENPDGMRKSAYQIANALIFKANFTALSSGLAPKAVKDFTQGLSSKIFSGSTSQQITSATELIGKAVQGSPLGKKLLNDVIHGAGIGTAFGVSQDIADRVLMGQDRTFGESVKGIAESAASMAAFSGIFSPIGLFAQKANNIERWKNSKDPIVITADAKNNPVEILRDGTGIGIDGRKVEVTPEMHDKAFAVPYSIIEKAQGEAKAGIEPTPKEREVTQYNAEMFANGVSDGRGNITIVTLSDGTIGYLKKVGGGKATIYDTIGNKKEIEIQDISNTEYTTVQEVVNNRMNEWDKLNAKQPEQQQLTGADPQQKPSGTDIVADPLKQQFYSEAEPTIHQDGLIHPVIIKGDEDVKSFVVVGDEKTTDPDEFISVYSPAKVERDEAGNITNNGMSFVTIDKLIPSEAEYRTVDQAWEEYSQQLQAQKLQELSVEQSTPQQSTNTAATEPAEPVAPDTANPVTGEAVAYPLDKNGQPDIEQMDEVQLFNYNRENFGEETAISDLQGDIKLIDDKITKAEKKLTTADTKSKIKARIEIQGLKEQKGRLEGLLPKVTTVEPALTVDNAALVSTPVHETAVTENTLDLSKNEILNPSETLTPAELDAIKALENGERVFVSNEIDDSIIELKTADEIVAANKNGYNNYELLSDEQLQNTNVIQYSDLLGQSVPEQVQTPVIAENDTQEGIKDNKPLPLPEGSARSGEVFSLPELYAELDRLNSLPESEETDNALNELRIKITDAKQKLAVENRDPEQDIVNPIDPKLSQLEKTEALKVLSDENKPIIDKFLSELDAELKTESKSSYKTPESIIGKANRPIIKAEKPWFDVEYLRDSFRFKTVIHNLDEIGPIIDKLTSAGFEIVKADVDKLFTPKEWGFRFVAFDLRMPNGQLVEYYIPLTGQEYAKKDGNHDLFDKWRGKDFETLSPEEITERRNDVLYSFEKYDKAWIDYLDSEGLTESAALAAFSNLLASASSRTGLKLSLKSSAENVLSRSQTPLINLALKSSNPTATFLPSSEIDANIPPALITNTVSANIQNPEEKSKSDLTPLSEEDAALNDLWDAFTDTLPPDTNIGDILTHVSGEGKTIAQVNAEKQTRLLEAGIKAITVLNNSGIYKFSDIVTRIQSKGIPVSEDFVTALKRIYVGYLIENTNPELDDFNIVRDYQFTKPTVNESKPEPVRDTETLATETESLEREAESIETPEQAGQIAERAQDIINEIDDKIASISLNLKAYSTEGINHEYPNISVEKDIKKDVVKFSKALAKALGWEHDADKKGKIDYGHANIAPAGGDAGFILWLPGSEYGVYVSIPYQPDYKNGYDNYKIQGMGWNTGSEILWRLTTRKNKYTGMSNQWIKKDITVGEFAKIIQKAIKPYSAETTPVIPSELQKAKELAPDRIIIGRPAHTFAGDVISSKITNFADAETFIDNIIKDFGETISVKRTKTKDTSGNEDGLIIQVRQNSTNQNATGKVFSLGNVFFHENAKDQEDFYQPQGRRNISLAEITQTDLIRDFYRNFDPFLAVARNADIENIKSIIDKYPLDETNPVNKEIMDSARARVKHAEEFYAKKNNSNDLEQTKPRFAGDFLNKNLENEQKKTIFVEPKENDNEPDSKNTGTTTEPTGGNPATLVEGQRSKPAIATVERWDFTSPSTEGSGRSQSDVLPNEGAGNTEGTSTGTPVESVSPGRGDGSGQETVTDTGQDVQSDIGGRNKLTPEQRNHVILPGDTIVPKGETAKIRANIEAIRIAKKLEASGKNASPAQKQALVRYTGWGGLANVFKYSYWDRGWKDKYEATYNELKSLLTPEELQAAKESTINAHYTAKSVIEQMWAMVDRLGFKGGTILEPAGGIGHFFGTMPESIANNSRQIGYELDKISGLIFQKLYPEANITVAGYETANFPNNSVDLAISNVPFGSVKVYDKQNKDIADFLIHNYFIAKSIRKLKPGGIGVFITTSATMDNEGGGKQFRTWAASDEGGNADLIDAVRLPNNAFKENAGTEVTTDILIFRKRVSGKHSAAKQFLNAETIANTKTKAGEAVPIRVNEYFAAHPERMLGEMKLAYQAGGGGLYTGDSQTLAPIKGADLKQQLSDVINSLTTNVADASGEVVQFADETTHKEGSIHVVNGKPMIVKGGTFVAPDWNENKVAGLHSKAQAVNDYNAIKEAIRSLITLETTADSTDTDIESARKKLNKAYDGFVKKYGFLNRNVKINFLKDDIENALVFMLEKVKETEVTDKAGKITLDVNISKSDIFTKRVNTPRTEPTKAESISDAVNISLAYKNKIDLSYVVSMLGIDEKSTKDEIISEGLGFMNPASGAFEDRDTYLSGYVKDKLEFAKEAAALDESYNTNVTNLEGVIPDDIPYFQINMQLGAPWIPAPIISEWIKKTIEVDADLQYNKTLNKWVVKGRMSNTWGQKNRTEFSGGGVEAIDLIMDALNTKSTVVMDSYTEGGVRKQKKNVELTAQAQAQQTALKMSFRNFAAELSEESRDKLQKIYNDTYNSFVNKVRRDINITHFPGASKDITLYPHQKIAAIRSLSEPTLLAHQVGTGKTFTLITAAMEMRRLGTAKKPLIVVQKATLGQFAESFKFLYPAANILIPTDKDMSAQERQNFFAKVALNDWDAVIVHHDALVRMPDDPGRQIAYVNERIEELQQALDEIEDDFSNKSIRDSVQREIDSLQEKIANINNPTVKDQAKQSLNTKTKLAKQADRATDKVLNFEQLGVDALLVDEAHTYKRLGFATKSQGVKGIDTQGSKKSFSVMLKIRHILENNGNKNVVFATGTPISNTMAEAWTMMKYLIPGRLKEYGVSNFDEFKTTFGEVVPSVEFTAAGEFKSVERFSKYINLPELKTLFRSAADVVLTEDIGALKAGVGTPQLVNDTFTTVQLDQTPALEAKMDDFKSILKAWEKLTGKEKRDQRHIPLVIFGLAKRAAIDVRLVDSSIKEDPGSKLTAVTANVFDKWEESKSWKGTQLIFADSYQSSDKKFNLYEEIKRQLVEKGVPANEIEIVNDHNSDAKRSKLFDKVNTGEVRVVLGSTDKLGIGVNVQKLLFAVHHIDAPNRPMDFEQRNGRILRQGNQHLKMGKRVHVVLYGVKKSLDATAYQRLDTKNQFIRQMLNADMTERTIEDTADDAQGMTFSQMMANLSGSQWAVIHIKKSYDLKNIEVEQNLFKNRQVAANKQVQGNISRIPTINNTLQVREKALELIKKAKVDDGITSITIDGKTYTKSKEEDSFGKVLADKINFELKKSKAAIESQSFLIDINKELPIIVRVGHYIHNKNEPFIKYQIHGIGSTDLDSAITGDVSTPEGVLISIRNKIKSERISYFVEDSKALIETLNTQNESLKEFLKQKFPKEDQIETLRNEVAELEAKMIEETAEAVDKIKDDADINSLERYHNDNAEEEAEDDSVLAYINTDYSTITDPELKKETIQSEVEAIMAELDNQTTVIVSETGSDVIAKYKQILSTSSRHKQVGLWMEKMSQVLKIVNNKRVHAFFDSSMNHIVIMADRIANAAQLKTVLIHESVHATNKKFLGPRKVQVLRFFYDAIGKDAVDNLLQADYAMETDYNQADEVIAYAVQKMIAEGKEPQVAPLKYNDLIDIVEGKVKIANFGERLISTIYYETYKPNNGSSSRWDTMLYEPDGRGTNAGGTNAQGQSQANNVGGNTVAARPRFAGELFGEGSIGLLKSVKLDDKGMVSVYHGGSVITANDLDEGEPLFVSYDKSQAQEYTKENGGSVSEFNINKNKISSEETAREAIVNLGFRPKDKSWSVDELNLFELIDPKFDTALPPNDIKTLFNYLQYQGFDGISFTDTNLKTLKQDIENVVIFNPKETLFNSDPSILAHIAPRFAGNLFNNTPPTNNPPTSVNQEVEDEMNRSHGIKSKPIYQKLQEWTRELKAQAHHFEHITEDEFPAVYNKLRIFESIPDNVRKQAYERIKDIVGPIAKDKALFAAFERHIVLSDLLDDIDNTDLFKNKELPWGYKNRNEVFEDAVNMLRYVNAHPELKKAISDRNKMMREVRQELIDNNLLPEAAAEKKSYFHHQVLDYMEARVSKAPGVSSTDVRNHRKGWQRGRTGSMLSYNTNYLESEFEVMAQSMQQIAIKEILNQIGNEANIAPTLIKTGEETGEDWHNLIPEGFTSWYPKKGTKAWYAASVAERAVMNAMENPDDAALLAEMVAEVNSSLWIIPEKLAAQLDSMKEHEKESLPVRGLRFVNSSWKQWILMNPYRVLRYNLNNLSGDLDIVLASNPGILKPKYAHEAMKELYANLKGGKMSQDVAEALKHGIITSGLSIQEIPDIQREGIFQSLTGKDNLLKRYWNKTQDYTQFRENLLRVAAYKYFKDKLANGEKMYGASSKKSIDAISDPNEKAAKIARELIGDYGNLSQGGQWLRSHIYPFWSWVEINSPRYFRLLKNTKFEGNTGTRATATVGKMTFSAAKLAVKMTLLMTLISMWNKIMFPDEDEELRQFNDRQLKLILGRREDGSIMTVRISGAFSDMLSWVGLQDAPQDVADLKNDKSTPTKKAKEAGSAFANKLLQGAVPFEKTLAEAAYGKTVYPDIMNPRPIRDRAEHTLRMVSMDKVYRLLTKKPLKGEFQELTGLIMYNVDPGEAAYYSMRQKAFDWLDEKGVESFSSTPTDKSNALYYYKQSLKYGDEKLAAYWIGKYKELGGNNKGMKQSVKMGEVKMAVKKELRQEWLNSLDAQDKEVLEIANKWYDKTYK